MGAYGNAGTEMNEKSREKWNVNSREYPTPNIKHDEWINQRYCEIFDEKISFCLLSLLMTH